VDLKFPHHTNEIAQAEAFSGKDWIPHWVHAGHLHIDGLKMSKSLKNFVTVREFMEKHKSSSPADDFRLWVLALSGSYRGGCTFSYSRLEEARTIREKILQFMMDADRSCTHPMDPSPWTDHDFSLYKTTNECILGARLALSNDLDGYQCLQNILRLVQTGKLHLRSSPRALPHLLQSLRALLRTLGFSHTAGPAPQAPEVLDSLLGFRQEVRRTAIDEKDQALLNLCDVARRDLAERGLDVGDGTEDWRWCVPKDPAATTKQGGVAKGPVEDVSSREFFRAGRYEGKFREFDEEGVPIVNSDGTLVSKTLRKKLIKKRAKHANIIKESK